MKFENVIYPGFNKTFEELGCFNLNKNNELEVFDYFNIDWVQSAITEMIKEIDSSISLKFIEPTTDDMASASKLVNADLSIEDVKKNFNVGKRIIGISSGKGGVGKSTISSLIGMGFAKQGKKVGILDADIWGYSIPKMLGAKFPPIPFNNRIFPSKINGLNVISMEYFVKQDEAVIWRGPMLHKAIEQFLYEVLWQDIDILLIDMPPGTGDVSISLSQFLNFYETIIVTTPQSNATAVAERAGIMSQKVNSSIIGVVENMSYLENGKEKLFPFGQGGGEELSKRLNVDFIGSLPLYNNVSEYSESGNLAEFASDENFSVIENMVNAINNIAPKKKPINLKIN